MTAYFTSTVTWLQFSYLPLLLNYPNFYIHLLSYFLILLLPFFSSFFNYLYFLRPSSSTETYFTWFFNFPAGVSVSCTTCTKRICYTFSTHRISYISCVILHKLSSCASSFYCPTNLFDVCIWSGHISTCKFYVRASRFYWTHVILRSTFIRPDDTSGNDSKEPHW